MDRARWRDRILPLAVLLMTALMLTAVTPAAMSAGLRVAAPPSLDCGAVTPAAAAKGSLASARGREHAARVQAQVTTRGELTGKLLNLQTSAGSSISVALPVESSVAPVAGKLVIYTRHAAQTGSEVRAVDLDTGCDTRLAAPSEIVRSAILDPGGTTLYVHSVTRNGRQDAGITRYDLDRGGTTLVMDPLPPLKEFGPTFGTELKWSLDGKALAVQSCGLESCRTRVLGIGTSSVTTHAAPGQGALIGLTADHLVTFAECPGAPRPVLSTDLATGAVSVLADEAYSATLGTAADGRSVVTLQTRTGSIEVEQ
jgi:hypothetical protein